MLNTPVFSASKIASSALQAPSIVEVITREEIDDQGWISLNDILTKLPGFSPAMDWERRIVSSRGFWENWNNNHLLHLVDGVPMNDNIYASAYTSEATPLFMVKNIEILRGPGSALYGTSAMNGVITVNTLAAGDLRKGGEFHTRLGDDGTQLYDWVGGFKGDGMLSAVAGYGTYKTPGNELTGYDGSGRGVDGSGVGTLQQFRTHDRRGNWYAWLKLEGEQDLRGLTLQFHNQGWDFQTVHGWALWTPDRRDVMREERRILSAVFKPPSSGRLTQEYVLRWQDHRFSWNMRFYPNGAFDGFYPAGAWEIVQSSLQDIFGRAQVTLSLPKDSNLLFGVEATRFSYEGDEMHVANFDPDLGGTPNPDNQTGPLGPWLDWIKDHPVVNLAPYAQFTSGGLLGEHTRLTLGARYDKEDVDFERIFTAGRPREHKSYSRMSPRVALVILPTHTLSIKLMVGRAFRAPAPADLAGSHTYSLASNIDLIKPEFTRTSELAVDWIINDHLNWRTNAFQTTVGDAIYASGAGLSLATNVLTQKTRGIESELRFRFPRFSGFVNASYAKRVDEEILDPAVAPSKDRLTWYPALQANAVVSYLRKNIVLSLAGHYQGRVLRRASEVGVQTLPFGVGKSLNLDQYRPRELGSWFTLDAKAHYIFTKGFGLFAGGTNLGGTTKNVLVKTGPLPFDFPQEGRKLYAGVSFKY